MIVGQEVESHGCNLAQQFVERSGVRGGRNVVACPLQTAASSSQIAEIVKMTGFDI